MSTDIRTADGNVTRPTRARSGGRPRQHLPGDPDLRRAHGHDRGGPVARPCRPRSRCRGSATTRRRSSRCSEVPPIGSPTSRTARVPAPNGAEYLDIARAAAPAVGWTGAVVTIDEVSYWHPATPTDPQQWKIDELPQPDRVPPVGQHDRPADAAEGPDPGHVPRRRLQPHDRRGEGELPPRRDP